MRLSITAGVWKSWCCIGHYWPGKHERNYGIAGAWLDSIPVLILAGQVKTSDLNAGNKLRQRGPQEIDLVSMVAKISKHSMTCLEAKNCLADIETGLRKAVQGRPGPVVFEIPLDIQSSIVDSVTGELVEDKKITQHTVTSKTHVVTEEIFQALMVASSSLIFNWEWRQSGKGAHAVEEPC